MFKFESYIINCRNGDEKTAGEILTSELEKRLGIIHSGITNRLNITLETDLSVPKDGYIVEFNNPELKISASGIRGFIYAIGLLLRKTEYADGKMTLIKDITGSYAPFMEIRGHQIGYRNISNTYDAWTVDNYSQYIRELMFFGCNTIEHIITDDKPESYNQVMKYSQAEFLTSMAPITDELGVDISIWFPDYNEDHEECISARRKIFELMPRIDYYFPPGSDPGEVPAKEFLRRTSETSEILKKLHPEAKTYPSAQTPDVVSSWGDEFINEITNNDRNIDGVVTGPNRAFPLHELREKVPAKYPIRLYPDISHNVRCEYPVHFDRDNWHYSIASAMGRETINPRPTEYRTIHRLTRQYINGSVSYSEGISDDVNKFVWSDMDYFGETDLRTTLTDYARLFFIGSDPDKIADGIFGLENNWVGDPIENPGIENTLAIFESELKKNPHLNNNFRFNMLLFRAKCDMLVKMRRCFESKLIEQAKYRLGKKDIIAAEECLNTPFTAEYDQLHSEIFELGIKLFDQCGIQLSTEKTFAHRWERGATLDTIDNPVTDRLYLINRIEYCKTLDVSEQDTYIERLLSRNDTAKDEYYYSFALNGFTELGVAQVPDFYMNFQGDNPGTNDGTIPMSMLKVFDHYVFKAKTGGLTSDKGYDLILNIKPRYNDSVTDLVIKINGNILYRGKQYGGERDVVFEKELSAPGFETRRYHIPDDFINNGCVDIEISEPKIGIMISELFIKKRS